MAKVKCNQCAPLMIQGVFCHETGCPNSRKVWNPDEEVWEAPEPNEPDDFDPGFDPYDEDDLIF